MAVTRRLFISLRPGRRQQARDTALVPMVPAAMVLVLRVAAVIKPARLLLRRTGPATTGVRSAWHARPAAACFNLIRRQDLLRQVLWRVLHRTMAASLSLHLSRY